MNINKDESLITHLEALRETLLKCIISLCIVLPFAFLVSPKILNFLINIIIADSKITLNFFSPAEVFILQIKTAIVIDLIVCFPYIAKKIWDFILPALYENERKFIKNIVLISTFLFICGAGFCIFVILPLVIKFGLSFSSQNINPMFGVSNIINLVLMMSIAFGVMFQMPLITNAIIKSKIVSYKSVSHLRPYIFTAILIVAAILTPPDVVSQLMLTIPTYLLFEIGLLFSKGEKNET